MRRFLALTATTVLLAGSASPASGALPAAGSAPANAGIKGLSVHYEVRPDGILEVTETFRPDSSPSPVVRAVRLRQDSTGQTKVDMSRRGIDRVWQVFDVSATSPTGGKVELDLHEYDPMRAPVVWTGTEGYDSRDLELHIELRSRPEVVVLRYKVRGALDRIYGGYQLNWPVIVRTNAAVAFDGIDARLAVPADLTSASCTSDAEEGSAGTRVCKTARTGRVAEFTTRTRAEVVYLDIAATFPATGTTRAGAILEESPTPPLDRIIHKILVVSIAAAVTMTVVLLVFLIRRCRRLAALSR